jgi:polysaccharide biosynthesis transport protein
MLLGNTKFSDLITAGASEDTQAATRPNFTSLEGILQALRRQVWKIATFALIGAFLAVLAALFVKPQYTAVASILIDRPRLSFAQDAYAQNDPQQDLTATDSQVELLRGEKTSLAVISKFNLTQDPEFVGHGGGRTAAVMHWLRDTMPFLPWPAVEAVDSNLRAERKALKAYRDKLDVRRVGRTSVLTVQFTAETPEKAANLANGVVASYLADQLRAKSETTRLAKTWLEDRSEELREKSLASDLAVQKFRAEHGLITAGGRLINEQQLQEMNSQLIVARTETARAQARLERSEEILKEKDTTAVVSGVIDNQTINSLRARYLDASKREAEISQRFGKDHAAAVSLRNDMADYERLIYEELQRVVENYRSEYQQAKARQDALSNALTGVAGASAADNTTLVQLRELEREADSYRASYQSVLQRYQEALQQQSFPIADARVVSDAALPVEPSFPQSSIFAAGGLLVGALIGGLFGFAAEIRDRSLRTSAEVRSALGLRALALVPRARSGSRRSREAPREGFIAPASGLMRESIEAPVSQFAEALRSVRISTDLYIAERRASDRPLKVVERAATKAGSKPKSIEKAPPKLIGIVSVLPDEGKTTLAKNLASQIASEGGRTLLVDADLRNPGLSKVLAPNSRNGLIAALKAGAIEKFVVKEEETGLDLLLADPSGYSPGNHQLLSALEMVRSSASSYDYVIFDFPPLGPVVDVRAGAALIDAFIVVVAWGSTPRALLRQTLEHEDRIRDRCAGVVLNKVDLKRLKLYERESGHMDYGAYFRSN